MSGGARGCDCIREVGKSIMLRKLKTRYMMSGLKVFEIAPCENASNSIDENKQAKQSSTDIEASVCEPCSISWLIKLTCAANDIVTSANHRHERRNDTRLSLFRLVSMAKTT